MRLPAIALFVLGFASVCPTACTTTCLAQSGAYWNYEGKTGPLVWGKLDAAYEACSRGHEQSPIDIRGARLNKALEPLEFHFVAGPMTLENTGRGIVAHVDPGNVMVAGGIRYHLIELDFHHPSEHPVKGKLSDMEVDMVYRNDDGKMAIVAVRLNQDRGFPNALLSTLWEHLPTKAGATQKITDIVSAGGLLPADRGYWTYLGSEVTPPCTEGARWFVFEEDLSMSREQLHAFTSLFRMNTRPVQDAHGRRIEANE
jgi:carbonic anhydrase